MADEQTAALDSTAVRVALWRAMHVAVDAQPHILEDEIGLRLAAPDENWRSRPDMDPDATRLCRASIVARARFIDDLVIECAGRDVGQYVILGAGLDTFAQRRPDIASRLRVFELDRPGPQAAPNRARFCHFRMAVVRAGRFEASDSWWNRLSAAGCRLRCRATRAGGWHRCQHVPHQGRRRGHIVPDRGARTGLHARDDLLLHPSGGMRRS